MHDSLHPHSNSACCVLLSWFNKKKERTEQLSSCQGLSAHPATIEGLWPWVSNLPSQTFHYSICKTGVKIPISQMLFEYLLYVRGHVGETAVNMTGKMLPSGSLQGMWGDRQLTNE